MIKHLSHNDWVIHQFSGSGLSSSYRNVILHASIIEGAARNASNQGTFKLANESLKNAGTITDDEFSAFEEVRDVRNKLVHGSFKDGLTQDQIEDLLNTLREKILTAYRISMFLENTLFKQYGIARRPAIALNVPS